MRTVAALALCLAACTSTVGTGPGQTVPPAPPHARLPRWEYFCVMQVPSLDRLNAFLEMAGNNGWELVSANPFCFKRPRVEPTTSR